MTDAYQSSLVTLAWAEGTCIAALVMLSVLLNNAHVCTPSWSVRCLGIMLLYGIGMAGGLSSWRWLAWLAWFAHLFCIGTRQQALTQAAQAAGTFKDVPFHIVGTRAFYDLFRTGCGTLVWLSVMRPVRWLVSMVLPEELTVYGNGIPVFDLGDNVDLGVAAYFAPPDALTKTKGPEHFVCNIGHIDSSHPGGMGDVQMTMNALRDVWTEFKKPTKGLLANFVCFFPRLGGTTFAKQINLSCWQSEADSIAWYSKSGGHASIMRQHAGGNLQTFGNLLATLKPHGKIRHQDRCSVCARLVESEQIGEHAPKRCKFCGGAAYGYPYF